MDAAFTEEQDEIRRTLRALLGKGCGSEEVRAAARNPSGHDPELWRRLAREAGLPGLTLPTAYGGRGRGPTELALACEETGRAVLPAPLIATTVLAAPLILALGGERLRAELLPGLATGELTATLAVPGGQLATALALTGPNDGDWAGGGRAGGIQARAVGQGWRLYGEAGRVLDGHTADVLVVAAHTGGFAHSRTLLFAVRAKGADGTAAPGLLRTRQAAPDGARPQARVELRDVAAELLGEAPSGNGDGDRNGDRGRNGNGGGNGDGGRAAEAAAAALAATGATAAACLAAEAVGAADATLSRTVDRVRERNRGGRPDGAFQAVQRRLVELYVAVQGARSAAYHAAWAAGGGRAEPGLGALALAQGLEALRAVAAEAVRLPGGVGSTGEDAAHLCFQRAAGDELLLGPVHRLRARAAEQAGLFGAGESAGAVADPAAREAVGA
ncbi:MULTISPECIES: acyl-CoA dehydrogenase family protein [unclassified Streptomyces]|uniref:acyl-CoA dehydrogenase family protein n=1 Tax=unclassified Streptomyces TaxID=2593676 RepID=UPI000369454E|nr:MULTISPECIES: acyl-CoA dehydrogenase family protein [unclassified Streptomyces]MYT31083.1 acyl-CoA dehydrogenase [Streptomyces sp. SID8354]